MEASSIAAQVTQAITQAKSIGSTGSTTDGSDFASSLDSALKSVSKGQDNAVELQRQFQLENPNVSLEDTMIAMNTSSISFQAAVQVRNKVVSAYESVMNMSV